MLHLRLGRRRGFSLWRRWRRRRHVVALHRIDELPVGQLADGGTIVDARGDVFGRRFRLPPCGRRDQQNCQNKFFHRFLSWNAPFRFIEPERPKDVYRRYKRCPAPLFGTKEGRPAARSYDAITPTLRSPRRGSNRPLLATAKGPRIGPPAGTFRASVRFGV